MALFWRPVSNPYFSNQAVSGLLQTGAADSLVVAANWIGWYLKNINPDGSIDNFNYDANGNQTSTGTPDSVDAYAGTFLSVLWQYVQAGGNLSLFQAVGVKQETLPTTITNPKRGHGLHGESDRLGRIDVVDDKRQREPSGAGQLQIREHNDSIGVEGRRQVARQLDA